MEPALVIVALGFSLIAILFIYIIAENVALAWIEEAWRLEAQEKLGTGASVKLFEKTVHEKMDALLTYAPRVPGVCFKKWRALCCAPCQLLSYIFRDRFREMDERHRA